MYYLIASAVMVVFTLTQSRGTLLRLHSGETIGLLVLCNQALGYRHNILIRSKLLFFRLSELDNEIPRNIVFQNHCGAVLIHESRHLGKVLISFRNGNKIFRVDIHRYHLHLYIHTQ